MGATWQDAGVAAEESRRQWGGRSMVSLTLGLFFSGRFPYGCGTDVGLSGGWERWDPLVEALDRAAAVGDGVTPLTRYG